MALSACTNLLIQAHTWDAEDAFPKVLPAPAVQNEGCFLPNPVVLNPAPQYVPETWQGNLNSALMKRFPGWIKWEEKHN